MISLRNIDKVERRINNRLVRQGFNPIMLNASTPGHFNIIGKKFNTTPVIYEYVQIESFGGSVKQDRGIVIKVEVPLRLVCRNFNGCTTYVNLFTFRATVDPGGVFDEIIMAD